MKVIKSQTPAKAFTPFELTLFFESKTDELAFYTILDMSMEETNSGDFPMTQELIRTIRDALDKA